MAEELLELLPCRPHGLHAIPPVSNEHVRDELIDARVDGRHRRRDARRPLGSDVNDELVIVGEVWHVRPTDDHLVEDGAQRVDVRSRIDVELSASLLGGHVLRRAKCRSCARELGARRSQAAKPPGDPEVEDLDEEALLVGVDEEDIARLHIAVRDVGGVCLLEAARDLEGHLASRPDRQGARTNESLLEVLPFKKLHRDEGPERLVPASVEDLHDVLTLDVARNPRLALEAPLDFVHPHVDELEGDAAPGLHVFPTVDGTHPARPNELPDPIPAPEEHPPRRRSLPGDGMWAGALVVSPGTVIRCHRSRSS